ncbi:MAG TPA: thiamine diphosphokinase, partial [Candidatus Jeotgalicoccus stercoravium]|nr:thiamine diphosphokinase [Candidatus Jeotgalicoccus stercoravium]
MTHINVLLRQVAVNEEIKGPWAGVDAGVLQLLEMNKQVTYAYGDFDSVNRSQLEKIRKTIDLDIVPSEKDYTDSELALLDLRDKGYK